MLCTSTSSSIVDVISSTFEWPRSTRPWVVTTVVIDADEGHARVQTMCAASGMETACSLIDPDYTPVNIQCYLIERGRWRVRSVTEVSVGMLGDQVVAVFRDVQGNDFCPDAPDVPASLVAEHVLVGRTAGPLPCARTAPAAGRQLHNAFLREHGRREGRTPSLSSAGEKHVSGTEKTDQTSSS